MINDFQLNQVNRTVDYFEMIRVGNFAKLTKEQTVKDVAFEKRV